MTQERENANEAKENPAMELPTDPSVLQQMVRHLLALVGDRDRVIERLRHQLEVLRRNQFGRKSERINPAQLNLFIQQIETAIANLEQEAVMPPPPAVAPDILPRTMVPTRENRFHRPVVTPPSVVVPSVPGGPGGTRTKPSASSASRASSGSGI